MSHLAILTHVCTQQGNGSHANKELIFILKFGEIKRGESNVTVSGTI